jgi:hypothetical protein
MLAQQEKDNYAHASGCATARKVRTAMQMLVALLVLAMRRAEK